MVGSLLKAKRGEVLTFYCVQCLRSHTVHQNYAREVSNYVSALELKLEKDNVSETAKNPSSKSKKKFDIQKVTKILTLAPPKNETKRKVIFKKKQSEFKGMIGALGWKNKYSVDSTKSYDPSLLSCSTEVEKFNTEFGKNNKFSSYKKHYSGVIKELEEMSSDIFEPLDKINVNSQSQSYVKDKNSFNELNENLKRLDLFKTILKKVQSQEPEEAVVPEKNIDKKESYFDQCTDLLTPDYSLLLALHSSIDICFTNDMILEAYNMFHTCRTKAKWKTLITDYKSQIRQACNELLRALSVKGYWNLTQHVIHCMEIDDIMLNAESYAALLCCLGRIRSCDNREIIRLETKQIMNELSNRNISLSSIFFKSRLTPEESEIVLSLLREINPNFKVKRTETNFRSSCVLLKNLYSSDFKLTPQIENFRTEEMNKLVDEQLEIEKKFFVKVQAVSAGQGNISAYHANLFDKLKDKWKISLTNGILNQQLIHKLNLKKNNSWINMSIYLNSIPIEDFVQILLESTLNLVKYSGGYSPNCEEITRKLGRNVAQRYFLRKKEASSSSEALKKVFKNYTDWYINPEGPPLNSRLKWELLIQDGGVNDLDMTMVKWPDEVVRKLGKCLFEIILKEVKFTTRTRYGEKEFPVLYTTLRYREGKFQEEIKSHPSLSELLKKIGFDYMYFRADEMPMLCPPKPWKSPTHGGYLLLHTKFVRPVGGVQGKTLNFRKVPTKDLFATLDSLNALQAVPWMVNESVLDVVLEVFKNGGSKELSVPEYPETVKRKSLSFEKLGSLEAFKEKLKEDDLKREFNNQYGLWCETLYRLSLANHFRKKMFWLPQNCDFRGRVYPVPPLLNHLGSDLFRSLLIFAKGKPLGPKGLDWLKIHLINLTGTHKKRSVKDRLAYANEILPDILDSAEKPLTGKRWWAQAEEPWQTLGVCMEIKKVLSAPNPEQYMCRLPVHQDGSCNGLQHYAALGRDVDGAKSVNLMPCEVPQDVYVVVAELVEKERVKDAALGINIAQVLEGFIRRKVVKQTIMTTVYGVTYYGAKLQIGRRLEEIPDFPKEYVKEAARYLTIKTFLCLKKMFTSARQIQEWFINCAGKICERKDYVQWISPLGLPVLQSYSRCKTDLQSKILAITPDTVKQKNAFPPNFIHSLDSCHMMLTALYCEKAGLTFAAVHDCFWTHPNTVDIMNKICREQFISLHSQPILEDLSRFFKDTYVNDKNETHQDNNIFEAVPKKGDFDLKDVMNSLYFFS